MKMSKGKVVLISILGILLFIGMFLAGGYNELVRLEERVTAAWAQVENVYQRRLDLIPNLVETVKGYAGHENETLLAVTQARAQATSAKIDASTITDPEQFAKFQQSQQTLSGALGRLLVVAEQYPDLKANQNFLELQAQLEGTENRIAVERARFNEAAQAFNTRIRQFPTVILGNLFGFKQKQYFKADAGSQTAPKVQF
jgi:LemA protein